MTILEEIVAHKIKEVDQNKQLLSIDENGNNVYEKRDKDGNLVTGETDKDGYKYDERGYRYDKNGKRVVFATDY